MGNSNPLYFNGERLRREAERRYGRKLSEEEWGIVDPKGWSAQETPYGAADLEDLLNGVTAKFPRVKLTAEQRVRRGARRSSEAIALRAQTFVMEQRRRLFGESLPPCKSSVDVEAWLDQHKSADRVEFTEITVTAVVRNMGDRKESLARVGQLILEADSNRDLGRSLPATYFDRSRGEHFRSVAGHMPVIVYFRHGEDERPLGWTYGWPAPPGTPLGNLYDEAEELSKKTGWRDYVCIHHIMTGELMSAPETVNTSSTFGSGWFGAPSITITIHEPANVTGDYVRKVFLDARARQSSQWPSAHDPQQRASTRSRQNLVAFIKERRPDSAWSKILEEWNDTFRNDQKTTVEALRSAYRRANGRT